MKARSIVSLWTLLGTIALFPTIGSAGPKANLFHGDLEMTGEEYQPLLAAHTKSNALANDPLNAILLVGKRNLEWINFINAARHPENQLELSSPATQAGIPITEPRLNNRQITTRNWDNLKLVLSPVVKNVLINNTAFTLDLEQSDEEFLDQARKVDRIYQMASRWLLQEPYLFQYANLASNDVRGYYFLNLEENLSDKLQNFSTLPPAKQTELKKWLIQQCVNNNKTRSTCNTQLATSMQRNMLLAFHETNKVGAARFWNDFFKISQYRSDVTWSTSQPNNMSIPFLDPKSPEVLSWLSENIEDEYQWKGWNLKLNFVPTGGSNVTHIVFEPGATPHVNGLAGSEITMDANRSINEYTSRWTIRHEYGHVLGLPDCYVEFYDSEEAVMVNYQLDITNLMCSRKGKFQQIHFDELQRVYFK